MSTAETIHVPGSSAGTTNESLFQSGYLDRIAWISCSHDGSNCTIKLLPLAKRPKVDGEQFPPTFSTEELLSIARTQLPSARSLQNKDIFIDGIVPVALALSLSEVCRLARSVSVNVPREGGWKKVSERNCCLEELAVGDLVEARVFGNTVDAEVKAVSDTGVQIAEVSRHRGQRTWLYNHSDLIGWKE